MHLSDFFSGTLSDSRQNLPFPGNFGEIPTKNYQHFAMEKWKMSIEKCRKLNTSNSFFIFEKSWTPLN